MPQRRLCRFYSKSRVSLSLYKYTYQSKGLEKFCNGLEVQCWLGLIGAFVLIWVSSAEITQVCINVFYVSIFFFFLTSPYFPAVFFMLFYFACVIGCVLKMLLFCKRRVGKQNLNLIVIYMNCMSVPSDISFSYNCEIDMQNMVGFCLLGLQCEINSL